MKRTGSPSEAFWARPPRSCQLFIHLPCLERWRKRLCWPEGADPLLGDGNYNWVALTLGYGTNQTFFLPWLTLPCCLQLRRWSKAGFFRPRAGSSTNRTSHLRLQWHLFDQGKGSLPPCALHCILLLLLPLASRVRHTRVTIICLEYWELLESGLCLSMLLN